MLGGNCPGLGRPVLRNFRPSEVVPTDRLASLAMGFSFRSCREKRIIGRWLPSLLLLATLACTGCKNLQTHDEGLRDSDLAASAQYATLPPLP